MGCQQPTASEDARATLLDFLGWEEPDESSFAQDVRIVLVSADFSRELTTSVMWLNERDLDIRCVQLKPYQLGEQLLVQVEQVIPLREATEYQVQVREKARRTRSATADGRDWTRYDLRVGTAVHRHLPKRRLVYHAVRHIVTDLGRRPEEVRDTVGYNRMWISVDGEHDAEGFRVALNATTTEGATRIDARRYLARDGELLHFGGRTYAFTKGWGANAIPAMERLMEAYPAAGIRFEPSMGQ